MNDPFTWTHSPKRWNPREMEYTLSKKPDNWEHTVQRLQRRSEQVKLARQQAAIIGANHGWRKWGTETLIRFLNTIKTARLRKFQWNLYNKVVKAELFKCGIQLKACYILRLETSSHLDRTAISKWIGKIIKQQLAYSYPTIGTYYSCQVKVVLTASKKLKDVLNTRCLKNLPIRDNELCHCQHYNDLIHTDKQHVIIKATDLTDKHQDLREILLLSNKNPIFLSNNDSLVDNSTPSGNFLKPSD